MRATSGIFIVTVPVLECPQNVCRYCYSRRSCSPRATLSLAPPSRLLGFLAFVLQELHFTDAPSFYTTLNPSHRPSLSPRPRSCSPSGLPHRPATRIRRGSVSRSSRQRAPKRITMPLCPYFLPLHTRCNTESKIFSRRSGGVASFETGP